MRIGILALGALLLGCGEATARVTKAELAQIKLPPGFQIELVSDQVPGARSLARGERGTIFVGTRETGKVYALEDRDRDGSIDAVHTIASGLDQPNGIALRGGALYVAEVERILRYDAIEDRLRDPPKPVVILASLPTERAHGWRYLGVGPDGLLYVAIGMPCNICLRSDARFGSILRLRADGGGVELFASGVRNSVGLDWHPRTRELWFTDNGGDGLGDDFPPDELNHAPRKGLHFGFPYCHSDRADRTHNRGRGCGSYAQPVQKLGAHVAALGMRFYTGQAFPERYRGQVFIAEHGSWNRSKKVGYRVTVVRLEGGRSLGYETFAQGWLQGEQAWGRPVDLLVQPDGSLLVSDDRAGAVYRIRYAATRR